LLTGLLAHHLRQEGCRALAMKPFCSGGRDDVEFLRAAQDGELSADEINPYFFRKPIAPLIAARQRRVTIRLPDVLRAISEVVRRCECLLIEGSGGLLVPLGDGYTVADLIAKLNCEVIVVARNRLGTINHTLLTVRTLQHIGIRSLSVVLMSGKKRDISSLSNPKILAELLGCVPLHPIRYLGENNVRVGALKKNRKKIKKTLARILG